MILEFTSERNKDLKVTERLILTRLGENASYTSRKRILELVMKEPAPHFYISIEMARMVIANMICGKAIDRRPLHRKGIKSDMQKEFFEVFSRLSKEFPDADRTTLLYKTINSSASGFFLTRRTVEEYLNRIK